MQGLPHLDDVIAALASAPGPAARGIVRITGQRLLELLPCLVQLRENESLPPSGSPSAARPPLCYECVVVLSTETGVALPCDLYLWPGRRSYTGAPMAELHTVGSPPLLDLLVRKVLALGARLAQPGEFTLRAFLAGRLDLTQAEAVLGVIDAHDARELQVALDQLAGGISSRIVTLRGELLDLLADLEAGLDFAHESLEFVSVAQLTGRLQRALGVIDELHNQAASRGFSQRAPRVVLAGPPNAGKSTLFNALTGLDAALVSAEPGTTRDYLSAELTWEGCTFMLVDTAGWDDPVDVVDLQAQQRRREQLSAAELVLACHAADLPSSAPASSDARSELMVQTKSDLADTIEIESATGDPTLVVSATTGYGLDELRRKIVQRLTGRTAHDGDWVSSTAVRGRESLSRAGAALNRALMLVRAEADQAILAIEIGDALHELGVLVGAVYTDDLLDRIFSRFCIGK